MQYCRLRIGQLKHTVRPPRRTKPEGSPLGDGAVRDTVPLQRDDRCAAVDIDDNLGVRARVSAGDHTAVTAKLCCEAGPAPAGRRRQQPGRTMVSDTTLLSLDRLLRLKYQPWLCKR
jgi:hypothetical protein